MSVFFRTLATVGLVLATAFAGAPLARADGFDDADMTLDQRLLEDGSLDITVAYGFQQKQPPGGGTNLIKSFQFDRESTEAGIKDFDKRIMDPSLGFKHTVSKPGENLYEAKIRRGNREYPVRVHVIYPTGRDSVDRLKQQFLASLKTSDVIIYNGHSRHGGGFPDFDRPVLGHGKVFNENFFTGKWSGLDKHPFNRFKKQVFVVNSCESKQYYQQMLRTKIDEKDPDTLALILTQAPGYVEDLAPTNIALIRGLMAGDDPARIMTSMNQAADAYYDGNYDPKTPPLFVDDGFVTRYLPAPWPFAAKVNTDKREAKAAPAPAPAPAANLPGGGIPVTAPFTPVQ